MYYLCIRFKLYKYIENFIVLDIKYIININKIEIECSDKI